MWFIPPSKMSVAQSLRSLLSGCFSVLIIGAVRARFYSSESMPRSERVGRRTREQISSWDLQKAPNAHLPRYRRHVATIRRGRGLRGRSSRDWFVRLYFAGQRPENNPRRQRPQIARRDIRSGKTGQPGR
jgi:hypothetical protein